MRRLSFFGVLEVAVVMRIEVSILLTFEVIAKLAPLPINLLEFEEKLALARKMPTGK